MYKLLLASALLVVAFGAETKVCYDCQAVARFISAESRKPEQLARVSEFIKSICATFPAAEDKLTCANIANNMPHIVKMGAPLLNDPTLMCIEAGLCKRDTPVHEDVAKAVSIAADIVSNDKAGPLKCGLCDLAMTFLNGMFNNLDFQQKVLNTLDGVCKHMSGYAKTICSNLVNTYIPKLFISISKALANGPMTCSMLKMCGPQGKDLFDIQEVVGMLAMEVAKIDTETSDDPSIQFVKMISKEAREKGELGKIACAVCEVSFTGLLGYFEKDNKAINGLANGISDMACNKVLPSAYNPDCIDFCHIYMAPVLQMTLAQVNPDMICKMLMMCKSQ